MKVKILSWNVRELNDPKKRTVIRKFIRAQRWIWFAYKKPKSRILVKF